MKEFKKKDLKSGYVVETKSGERLLVSRAGNFTHILVNTNNSSWIYLNESYDENLCAKKYSKEYKRYVKVPCNDIVKVYGLVIAPPYYTESLTTNVNHREILWERGPSLFEKACLLHSKYNLSIYELENTFDDIQDFVNKMSWLISNTEQVTEEDAKFIEKFSEEWCE